MSKTLLNDYKRNVRHFLFSDGPIDSKDFMVIYDQCFKLSTEERETELLVFLCECFFTLRNQAAKIIDIDKGKTRYITNHPIIENKEMNKRIALEAFGSREQDELQK